MSISEQLSAELKDAMKAKDAPRRDVIRQVQTEITLAKSETGYDASKEDEIAQAAIEAYSKRMQKSLEEYEGYGDRAADMVEKLRFEIDYLERWMPERMSEDDTRELIRAKIEELGVAGDETAAGRVTGMLMKERGEDLDGATVNRLVREELS